MKSKNQIANQKYGYDYNQLEPGEKAAVTRAYNAQRSPAVSPRPAQQASGGAYSVKFGRPGINGVKECLVEPGTTIQEALEQANININPKKEGVLTKGGATVLFKDVVVDNTTYVITPGVDSSSY